MKKSLKMKFFVAHQKKKNEGYPVLHKFKTQSFLKPDPGSKAGFEAKSKRGPVMDSRYRTWHRDSTLDSNFVRFPIPCWKSGSC